MSFANQLNCLRICICSVLQRKDGREEHFNFPEAGMLVQGISDVYCRKIEYVYELAIGFSDQMRLKKSRKKNGDYGHSTSFI